MTSLKWLCVISVLLSTSGCSMLTSRNVTDDSGWPISAGGLQYSLPTARVKVKLSHKGGNILQIRMEQPVYEADPKHTYLLRYETSPFASDKFDIEVDPKTGLLTKVDMTADDKLDEIAVEIAKAVAALEAAEEEEETVLVERSIDPTDESQLNQLENEFNNIGLKITKQDPGIRLFVKEPYINTSSPAQSSTSKPGEPTSPDCTVGVCYRQVMPYVIGFSFNNSVTYETAVNLPNNAPIIPLAMDRSPFVTRVNTIEFENGIPKKIHVDKPSEGLELAQLPLEIVKGILTAPAEILQLKADLSGKEKALAEAKVAEINAEKVLREKQVGKESSRTRESLLVGTSEGRVKKSTPLVKRQGSQLAPGTGSGEGARISPSENGTLP